MDNEAMLKITKIDTPKLPNYVDVDGDTYADTEKIDVDVEELIEWGNKLTPMLDAQLSCMNYQIQIIRRDMATTDDIKNMATKDDIKNLEELIKNNHS